MTGATAAHPRPDPLDDDLGWMLGVVFRAYVRAADRALEDIPGGPRGYQVLSAAVREPVRNQGAIAEELGIDRTVLTYLIDDLERRGLVLRRADPADRRSRLVCATDEGRVAWRERQRALRQVESHVLGALDPADTAAFRTLLRRVACAAQRRDPLTDLCEAVAEAQPTDAGPSPARPRARRKP
ncbi:MarR family winged helix-turn-helix transcriptional regulator [Micromonospora sp. WMMD558]|uniref:MarR family winged helix-turn-helix transcriptional regulator n=1 Tax=unclassified Micromonospora TaxID=2617518 RepID=UPI0012B4A524|nr:MarR family winged helix-turn-helix transcriptional regulator [Micromonospora sp. WMMC415]QGN49150.1 MarR family transcriptional regulator [Micromonospora sp. WMMC415]